MRIHKSVMEDRYISQGNLTFAIASLIYVTQCVNRGKGQPRPPKPRIQDHFPFKLPAEALRRSDGKHRTKLTKSNLIDEMISMVSQ